MSPNFVGADGPLAGLRWEGLLPDDAPIWAVADLVDGLDLSGFEAAYRCDGSGGRPYDPRLMITVILHCYRLGIRSPTHLADACRDRVDLRVLLGGRVPVGRTWRRFVGLHAAVWPLLFTQVLARCDQQGLVDVAVTATDGSPVRAAASLTANRTMAWITEQVAAVHNRLDALEGQAAATADALNADTDLDQYIGLVCADIPAQAGRAHQRLTRLLAAQAVAASRAAQRSDTQAGTLAVRVAKAAVWPPRHEQTLARLIAAQDAKVADYHQRADQAASHGRRLRGHPPTPTERSTHIIRQRQTLAAARQRLADLQNAQHP
jgi:transposase